MAINSAGQKTDLHLITGLVIPVFEALDSSSTPLFTMSVIFSTSCIHNKNCVVNKLTQDTNCETYINPQIHNIDTTSTYFTTSNIVCLNSIYYTCQYTVTCDLWNDYWASSNGPYTSNTITISTKYYCSTVSCYAKISASNPSSYTVEQYSGTSNINSQTAVLITEYFTILNNSCSFQSCNMYLNGNLDSSVIVVYAGTGSTATVVFKIVTSSSFSSKSLYLGCSFSGSTNIAYSSNSIAFTVNPCTLTGISPVSNSYTYIQALYTGSANEVNLPVSNYFTGQSSTCYFESCYFEDSLQTTLSIVEVSITSSAPSQKFTFTTTTSTTFTVKTLYLKCLVANSWGSVYVTNSNPISFTVNFCQYTSQLPPSYTLEQYQNGNSVSYKYLKLSSLIFSQYYNCTLSNCNLVDSLGKKPSFANFTQNPSLSAYALKISTKLLTSRFEKGSTQIKLKCDKIEGGQQESQFFSIEVICSPTSVQVQATSSLKEVTYYLINKNVQATYMYDNFTSSNATACPILSHKLATSQSNLTSPSQITLVEGKQSFQIQNISMSSNAFMYPVYIVATAQGGAVLIQKVFIYNFVDCNDDSISLTQSLPDRKDPNLNLYVKQNKISVLQINLTFDAQFEANIYKRFTSILSEFCPLSEFRIKKVFCNQKEVTDFKTFLSISNQGVFKISKKDIKEAQKCQVYIETFNTKKWGGGEQYLVQINLQQKVLDKIGLPQLIEEPKQIDIDLSSARQNYFSIKLPKVNENTCQINLINKHQLNFLSVTFDAKTLISYMKIEKSKIITTGVYSLVLQLVNAKGLYQYYTIQINITKSYSQFVSASIASIDQYGLAIVKFSEQMILNKSISWINYTKQNLLPFNNSWINQSNTFLKVLPSKGRNQDEGFNQSLLNLNWNVMQVTNTSIAFQIIFENPIQISPQIAQDKLQIFFNGSLDLLVSQANLQSLDKAYQNLTYNIKKQLFENFQTQSLRTAGKYMNKLLLSVLILSIFLNLIGQGCVENMLLMFRSLQIVMHLPILQVVFPANALAFFQYIIKLVQFDILEDLPLFEQLSFIQYDHNAQPLVIGQMLDIGYDNRNAFSGLKLITLVLFLFFTRIFLSLCTGFFVAYKGWKNRYLNKAHCYIVKGLYFNQIIRISMEAYFEFFLIGYMNYQTANLTLNGEILGVLETIFVLFMILIVLTFLSVFILFKTKQQLEEKGNKNLKFFIGELYESTKIDSKLQSAYTLLFLLRRFSFLSIATFIQDDNFAGIQIIAILVMNLAWMIYIGFAKAQKEQLLNQIEKWNEIFVQFSTLILPLFTNYVQNLDIQYMYGWFIVASFSLHLIFNLIYVFRHFAKIIKQYCLLIYNYANYFYDKKKFKFLGNNEDKVQEEEEQEKSPEEILRLQILEKQKMKGKSVLMKYKMKLFQLANKTEISNVPNTDQQDQNLEESDNNKIGKPFEAVKQNDQSKIDESVQKQNESSSNLNSNKIKKNNSLIEQNQVRKTNHQNNYLQNFRKKRDQMFQIRESLDDQTQQEFRDFLLSHKDLFESCVQENNLLEEMGKDLRYLTFKETDSYMTINSKEIKISQYVQFLLLNYSHLKDPETAYLTFDKDLNLFTDYLSDKKKNQ